MKTSLYVRSWPGSAWSMRMEQRCYCVLRSLGWITVMLVHGWGGSFESTWQRNGFTALLEDGGKDVIGVDLLGHGDAPKPHEPEAYCRPDRARRRCASRRTGRCHRVLAGCAHAAAHRSRPPRALRSDRPRRDRHATCSIVTTRGPTAIADGLQVADRRRRSRRRSTRRSACSPSTRNSPATTSRHWLAVMRRPVGTEHHPGRARHGHLPRARGRR